MFADREAAQIGDVEELNLLRTAAEMLGHTVGRWRAESDLLSTRDNLEMRVQQRTAALNQTNLALQMLNECNWAISQAQNEDTLLREVCRIAVETGGYRMAWIGYARLHEPKLVHPKASAGHVQGYLETLKIVWDDPHNRDVTGTTIRSGKPQVIRNIERASEFSIRRSAALKRGYRSAIALPLFLRGRVIGALNIYSQSVNAFGSQEIELLTDLAENLSYGIQAIRDRLGRERTEAENRQLLESLDRRLAARTQELATLFELATLAGGEQSLIDRFSPVISRVMETGYCQVVSLHLLNEDRDMLNLFVHRALSAETAAKLHNIPLTEALKAWLNVENAPIVDRELAKYEFLPPQLASQAFNSFILCQIRRHEQPQGMIVFYRTVGEFFTLDEISFLVAVGEQINFIIENHHMKQHITDVAITAERQRLSRDLHDSVAQSLYGLTLLSRSGREAAAEGDLDQLEETLTTLESSAFQALKEMRLLLFELRPMALQQEGLVKALNLRLEMVERRAGVKVVCELDDDLRFFPEVQSDLYMIATEALNNVLKHALANQVCLTLQAHNGNLEMEIVDNGCGFDTTQVVYGLGLQNMTERAEKLGAHFELVSAPGEGTRIFVQLQGRS